MRYPNLEKYLQSFGNYIKAQSRANLTRGTKKYGSKNNTKQLYNSIRYEVQETTQGLSIKFFMLEYGEAVDKGVDGVKTKHTYFSYKGKFENTPGKGYTNKMPPPSKLDKWIVMRGLAPRDKSGKFKGRSISKVGFAKSISFLIAKKIQMHGIKGISFFQKPLYLAFKTIHKEVLEAARKDIIDNLKQAGWR